MILTAPAKVNLHLSVLEKRPDSFHNIETVFERIDLQDKIEICSLPDGKIKILSDNPKIPLDKDSLIYRTAEVLKKSFNISKGVKIKIFKKIPIAAGLGGGSSDAANVLLGLTKFWKISLSFKELLGIASKLGADVPFFLGKASFAKAEERGDKVTPLNWKIKLWHLLIIPPVELLSGDIYKRYADKYSSDLTKRPKLNRILSPFKRGPKFDNIRNLVKNDLEEIVLDRAPICLEIKKALKNIGFNSLVSGSGPSVFSLFNSRKEAKAARELLGRDFPSVENKNWQTFIVATL